jgi:outer membrane protein W
MKKYLALALAVISLAGVVPVAAQSQPADDTGKKNYIGPQVNILNAATGIGANARFGVADNISVRPFVSFASAGAASATFFGAAATYDFSFDAPGQSSGFEPYAGVGYMGSSISGGGFTGSGSSIYFEIGSDYNVSDSIVLNANYRFRDAGFLSLGGGFRF